MSASVERVAVAMALCATAMLGSCREAVEPPVVAEDVFTGVAGE